MKNCGLSFLLFLLSCVFGAASLHADALADGNAAAAKGDFSAAARDYQTALSAGPISAGLYGLLGQAQMKAGQPAAAALSLHRALLLDPRLADARTALADLERAQGITPAPADWRSSLAQWIALPPLVITGTVLFWLGAFLFLALLFQRPRKMVVVPVLLLLAGLVLFLAGALADPRLRDRNAGVIVSDKIIPLLSAPADQSDSLASLPPASCVEIVRRSGDWTYCAVAGGQKGWVPSSTLQSVIPSA